MRRINILNESVYNRIAAGEVVDRPYSVVKELIENSLDAGATDIRIDIEAGGKELIRVSDNGSGIERDDLRSAFMPHATSKIACADDLNSIQTLGFRGEALASISAISKAEILSVVDGAQAYRLECNGGKTGEIMPSALQSGTVITVRNLFFNTPVRAKFLKPDKKEEADITSFITKYILGNPNVSFTYFADGKQILQSFGGGLDEALAQIYGAKTLAECYKINAEKDGFRIHGFIGNQNFFKPNKTYQSIFLNGRYVVNNTIATAINNAYASYMMKRQFPFYVLNIDVPSDFVDVNVHPNKADVRFVDNRTVFGAVYSVISSVLDGTARAAEFVVSERLPEMKSTSGAVGATGLYSEERVVQNKPEQIRVAVQEPAKEIKAEPESKPEPDKKGFDPVSDMEISEYLRVQSVEKMRVTDDTVLPTLEQFICNPEPPKEVAKQEKIDLQKGEFKGDLFNTYLLYELNDTVYVIDQHAAHERLIFDELCKKYRERTVDKQPMLIPYIFNTNPAETLFIEENIRTIRAMGFGLSPFGPGSFRIDEVPVELQQIDIKGFIDEILSQINSLKKLDGVELLRDKLAMTACKHAIKGGMCLTNQEIDALIKLLDGNVGLKCPHGRPVCVTMKKRDIEKMFKRIV